MVASSEGLVTFAVVGGGWRSRFYLRVAQALPDRFCCVGMVVRDPQKGLSQERAFGVTTHRTLDALLAACSPTFVVTSVPWAANPGLVGELVDRGQWVLSETPPAPDLDGLRALWSHVGETGRVQVAEQYIYQPRHAARLEVARSGMLGTVTQAQVSAAHGYHGVSLVRHYLGIGYEDVAIRAREWSAPLVAGPGRDGPPTEERLGTSTQTLAWLDWGERFGVFDFTGDQYFSWVRSERVLLRGERGEVNNAEVRWLPRFDEPAMATLRRETAGAGGNLEGMYLKGFLLGPRWVYRNPLAPGRLADDEIAVGTVMLRMAEYVHGGGAPYPLAEACQDHYLSLLINEAARTGEVVRSERQPWAA